MCTWWTAIPATFCWTPNRNSLDGTIEKLARGVAGHVGFVSRTADTLLYLSHVPVGINNWSVLVSVEQQHAFAESRDIRLTHEQIARYMGSAREVVSRLVKYFSQEGYVKSGRGHLTVLDADGLRRLAGNPREM